MSAEIIKRSLLSAFGVLIAVLLSMLSACSKSQPQLVPSPSVTISIITPATSTPFQPSPTPEPGVAQVNGEIISVEEYEAELARYQAAVGGQADELARRRVLDELVDQLLLAQAAVQEGYLVDEADLQTRYDDLSTELGGEPALLDWIAANGYTQASFRQALARASAAAWMRDHIAAGVPITEEQIHARQILLYNEQDAAVALQRLQSGTDFASLAAEVDPVSGGDLDWFPRGYLLHAQLEVAAFALQLGEFSQVIATPAGYHIVQVLERDAQRPLGPDARRVLQEKAVRAWLEQRRQSSDIQITLP